MSAIALRPSPGQARLRGTQAGLTLVEAVTGLLILGVLAAVAVPRYADVQAKAREVRVKGLAQSLRMVAVAARSQAEAQGISCAADGEAQVRIDEVMVPLRHCYPRAQADLHGGLLAASGLLAGEAWLVRRPATVPVGTVGELLVQAGDAPDPARCAVRYVEAPQAGESAEVSPLLGGC